LIKFIGDMNISVYRIGEDDRKFFFFYEALIACAKLKMIS